MIHRQFYVRAGWALMSIGSLYCGAAQPPVPVPIVREGPDDAILRIGSRWEAQLNDRGFRSKPNPVASFDRQVNTRIVLEHGVSTVAMAEQYRETFVLVTGETIQCSTATSFRAEAAYGFRNNEAALQLEWSAAVQPRSCVPSDSRIPPLKRPAGKARFTLRSDRLVAVEPALEKRQFIPVD